jgi:hypothetical protein
MTVIRESRIPAAVAFEAFQEYVAAVNSGRYQEASRAQRTLRAECGLSLLWTPMRRPVEGGRGRRTS